MDIRPIKTGADHRAALQEVSALVAQDPALDTPEGDRLDVLVTLVQAHEARHFPIGPPTPIEAIKFRMERQGLTPKDLQPMIGGLNRVCEVLAGRRLLTLAMVRRLHNQLGIPAESLIGTGSTAARALLPGWVPTCHGVPYTVCPASNASTDSPIGQGATLARMMADIGSQRRLKWIGHISSRRSPWRACGPSRPTARTQRL